MGYDAMVKRQVKKAFASVKDLAYDVTFSKAGATSFDFNSGAATVGAATSKTVKGLLLTKRREDSVRSTVNAGSNQEIMMQFMTQELGDPSTYDKITFKDGRVFNIVHPVEDDGYLIKIRMMREA